MNILRQPTAYNRTTSSVYDLRHQRGFTLLELVIVITIIALLSSVALPKMMAVHEDAQQAAVQSVGAALASAVIMAKGQWIANGTTIAVDAIEGYGANDIACSSKGWPTDAKRGSASNHNATITSAERCARLWSALLIESAPKISIDATQESDYTADTVNGSCRYTYRASNTASHIVYNPRSGEVSIDI